MSERAAGRLQRGRADLAPVLNLGLFALALVAVDHVVAQYRPGEVVGALGSIPPLALVAAAAAAALGYLALVAEDHVAFRIVGRPLPFRSVLVPSFVSFAVAASAPGSMLTGGGVRYRMYEDRGVSAPAAAAVAIVDAVTWLLGLLLLAGAILLTLPVPTALARWVPAHAGRVLGGVLLAVLGAYLAFAALRPRPLRLGRVRVPVPTLRLALGQLATSLGDWLCTSASLYVLLASVEHVPWAALMAVFFVAQAGTLLLPVPGGIGVFEAIVLLLHPGGGAGPRVLAALLAYRVVYYLLPLVAAGALALRLEVKRAPGTTLLQRTGAIAERLAPHLLAALTFFSGWLLFVTGAIPQDEARVAWLAHLLPPALVDASQFLASIVGAALLVVAWGLERRMELAYRAAVILFGWGILLALTRSMDLELAVAMAVVLGVIVLSAKAFPETPASLRQPMGGAWAFAVGAALVVSVWVGVLGRRGAEAAGVTWWRFTLFGAAPAYVRAAVGGAVALLLLTLARLLGRRPPPPGAEAPPPAAVG